MRLQPWLTASGSIALRMCGPNLFWGEVGDRVWDGLESVSRALPLFSIESSIVLLPFDGTPALESACRRIIYRWLR